MKYIASQVVSILIEQIPQRNKGGPPLFDLYLLPEWWHNTCTSVRLSSKPCIPLSPDQAHQLPDIEINQIPVLSDNYIRVSCIVSSCRGLTEFDNHNLLNLKYHYTV